MLPTTDVETDVPTTEMPWLTASSTVFPVTAVLAFRTRIGVSPPTMRLPVTVAVPPLEVIPNRWPPVIVVPVTVVGAAVSTRTTPSRL